MGEYYNPNPAPTPVYTNTQVQNNPRIIRDVPVGAKIISVFYYIGAVMGIIGAIISIFSLVTAFSYLGSSSILILIVPLILSIGVSILFFFMGKGLWKGQNWARITAIVFAILGVIAAIIGIVVFSVVLRGVEDMAYESGYLGNDIGTITDIIGPAQMIWFGIIIAINALIAGYLLFSKRVKEAFKKQ